MSSAPKQQGTGLLLEIKRRPGAVKPATYDARMGAVDGFGHGEAGFTELVKQALEGSQQAWTILCLRLQKVVWRAVNGLGLGQHDSHEAFAATFFRLYEKLDTVRDPEYLPGWIATTARNEARSVLRANKRMLPMDEVPEARTSQADPSERLIEADDHARVRGAFGRLRQLCQDLLRLVTADPRIPYEVISAELGIPIGSIGPTRGRCLDDLRSAMGAP